MQIPTWNPFRHRVRGAQLVVIACLALGCVDRQITQPVTSPAQLSPAHPAFIATPIGSYTVTMPPNNTNGVSGLPQYWVTSGGVAPTGAISIPPGTAFRVRVSGFVTVSPNPQHQHDFPNAGDVYGSVGSYGPLGSGNIWNELKVYLDMREGGNVRTIGLNPDSGGAAVSGLDYTTTGGTLWVGHAGVWGAEGDGGTIYDGLYALAGGQVVTVDKITNVVALSANPSRIRKGTSANVAFTATTADSTIPWHIGSWNWTPDVGAAWPGACQNVYNPCTIGVGSAGTMTVTVWSGSAPFTATARVTVYGSFTLDADKTSLVSGDSVTFTPRLDGVQGKVARWLWRGDDGSVVAAPCAPETDTCVRRPNRSGTMWAYTAATGGDSASKHVTVSPPTLQLIASKSSVLAPGENVTFTVTGSGPVTVLGWSFDTTTSGTMNRMAAGGPSLSMMPARSNKTALPSSHLAVPINSSKLASQGSSWDACGASSAQCTNFVGTSGIVDVLASVNGDTVRANVPVNVVPCPTQDPVLDSPAIRTALKNLINISGPNLPPGDGITFGSNVGNKREHAGSIYRRPNGTYYFVEDTQAIGNECSTARVPSTKALDTLHDVLVAIVHTHPTKTNKAVYGCPVDTSGVATKQGPWDNSTPWVKYKAADATNGGGSENDWAALRAFPANQVPYPMVDGYVINADGEVWLMTALDAWHFADQKNNRRVHRYSGNNDKKCDW